MIGEASDQWSKRPMGKTRVKARKQSERVNVCGRVRVFNGAYIQVVGGMDERNVPDFKYF